MILKTNSFSLAFTEAFWSKRWTKSWSISLSWSRSGGQLFSRSLSYSWRVNSSNWSTCI